MSSEFRPTAPSAETVFYRSYSRRKANGKRESFVEAMTRAVNGVADVGGASEAHTELMLEQALAQHTFPSGRAFWVGGSEWAKRPENFYGWYNCSSVHIDDLKTFGLLMDMAMQGTGTGAVLEKDTIDKLPAVRNRIEIIEVIPVGDKGGNPHTNVLDRGDHCVLQVGDSRKGWVDAYQGMINAAFSEEHFQDDTLKVVLDLSNVRPSGERLKGFGGTANPIKLEEMFRKVADLLNGCQGRKMTSVEACLLIDEAAACVVAGNIRRCLPAGSMVHTVGGLVPIEEVRPGALVRTSQGYRHVVDFFDQGLQIIYIIRTADGDLRCSKEHKVAVLQGSAGDYEMIKACDLGTGDRMLRLVGDDLIPATVLEVIRTDTADHTYDIEVAELHEFICEGFLVSNSAGMRQFSSDDQDAIHAKEGLYSQDEEGNWRVDPKKEALRMANHTICYHHKPTLDEIKASVTKQFYSGEGAIQYSPEGIARANADLLPTAYAKDKFIRLYEGYGKQAAKNFLYAQANAIRSEKLDERELEHRIGRYGANPCAIAGTMVMTREGYFPIESLVGKEVEIHDGERWRKINNFRVTGTDQDVYDLELHDGTIITTTAYHTFILKDGTRKELKDLRPGEELMAAQVEPVKGTVTARGGYLKGFLIGDGTSDKGKNAICKVYAPKLVCLDRLVDAQKQLGMREQTTINGKVIGNEPWVTPAGYLRNLTALEEDMNPWCHRYKHEFPYEVLNWTDEAKAEFLAGLFDADGAALDTRNGYSYQLTSVSRPFLEGLVNLLRTLGITSKIGPVRHGGKKDFGPERGGVCHVQDAYRVAIPQTGSVKLAQLCKFERLKSFADRTPAYQIKSKANRVKSITFSHVAPEVYCCTVEGTHAFTLGVLVVTGQCHEVMMKNSLCNLSEVHLNTIDPQDKDALYRAFYAAGLQVACLLKHKFIHERIQYSREIDPIVGVSFTGLFDFFVTAFGTDWLDWMLNDRPEGTDFERLEQEYLVAWKQAARDGVYDFCTEHGIRLPNRWTVVQPAGSKSLLTGASSGWHPPYAQRFIRRITLGKQDPLVSALRDWGYPIVPAPSARDDEGNLLNDIADPRVHEVLVEIPTEVSWANLPGADKYDLNQISAVAQMRLYMNVQRHYTTHTTSATISFRENEIDALSQEIHDAIGTGYIGVALLARFDANATFPRLPFEPITKEKYDELMEAVNAWRLPEDEELGFLGVLDKYDRADYELVTEAACTSAACIARAEKDEQEGKA